MRSLIKKKGEKTKKDYQKYDPGSLSYICHRLSRSKSAMFEVIVIAAILILCFLSPYILKYDYAKVDILNACAKPSLEHPFGCDEVGRDILARVLYGARYTLSIGVLSTLLGASVGITIGSVAGFFGGIVDTVLMRMLDIIQAFPQLLMAMTLAAILGTGLDKCILALGISTIAGYARMTRANILNIRNSEYIEAAISIKCSTPRIIFRHILPNVLSPLIISAAIGVASSGLSASALSFIGLGIQPPKPEWGAMLSTARSYIRENPHMVFFPGLFIMLTVLSLNMIGDALRDILDPKLKE